MRKLVFDQFPFHYRVMGAILLVGIGALVNKYVAEAEWAIWVGAVLALLLVLVQESLTIHLGRGTWVYRRGVWPLMVTHVGGFEQLYGIEITKTRFEDSEDVERYHSTYTASLHWREGSPGKKALYTGRSFNEAARPAVRLANALRIPILLDRDMRAYDQHLGQVQREASGDPLL